jgi:hypothetical protein
MTRDGRSFWETLLRYVGKARVCGTWWLFCMREYSGLSGFRGEQENHFVCCTLIHSGEESCCSSKVLGCHSRNVDSTLQGLTTRHAQLMVILFGLVMFLEAKYMTKSDRWCKIDLSSCHVGFIGSAIVVVIREVQWGSQGNIYPTDQYFNPSWVNLLDKPSYVEY